MKLFSVLTLSAALAVPCFANSLVSNSPIIAFPKGNASPVTAYSPIAFPKAWHHRGGLQPHRLSEEQWHHRDLL